MCHNYLTEKCHNENIKKKEKKKEKTNLYDKVFLHTHNICDIDYLI